MSMEFNDMSTQVIDTALGLELANNKPDLAQSLLEMLVEELPAAKTDILAIYNHGDMQELCARVHKLHGGCAYCGVPRLKAAAFSLETALKEGKSDPEDIDALVKTLTFEIEQVLACYEQSHA